MEKMAVTLIFNLEDVASGDKKSQPVIVWFDHWGQADLLAAPYFFITHSFLPWFFWCMFRFSLT